MFTIAIVGRPNVGKSSLFNKFAGQSLAIVNDFSGVTRDRKEALGSLGPMEFNMIDTPGWENNLSDKSLESRMVEQTETAIRQADLCLFMVDGKSGVTSLDQYFAQKLRKIDVPTVLVVNKCEASRQDFGFGKEYYKLGFGEPVGISAEHKIGFNFLYDAIEPNYEKYTRNIQELNDNPSSEKNDIIQVAIIGRPNAGKSTLINQLLGEERLLTGKEPGITRDSISIDWEYKNHKIKLIDTAGIRKKKNIYNQLEKLAVDDAKKALKFAQVAILLMDASICFDAQDLAIASMLVQEGRGVVFALNKWDTITDKQKVINEAIYCVEKNVPEIKGAPIIPISALNGANLDKLLNAVLAVYESWNTYVKTSDLNNWLTVVQEKHTPPLFRGKSTKLKYITQAKKRPPTFVLFTNSPERLEATSYNKYLINSIRDTFGLNGTVIRLLLRKADNPYKDRKTKFHNKKKH